MFERFFNPHTRLRATVGLNKYGLNKKRPAPTRLVRLGFICQVEIRVAESVRSRKCAQR